MKRLLLHAWRLRSAWRYRRGGPWVERVAGRRLVVFDQVMSPRLFASGAFFAEHLRDGAVRAGERVLDLGTGSGVCALIAAATGASVVAVDINPAAVRNARVNALVHGLEARVEVREGDLFGPVSGERFDLVLCNPPWFPGDPEPGLGQALFARDFAERFAAGLAAHLQPHGRCLLLLSDRGAEAAFLGALRERGFIHATVATRRLPAERLAIHAVRGTP